MLQKPEDSGSRVAKGLQQPAMASPPLRIGFETFRLLRRWGKPDFSPRHHNLF